MPILYGFTLLVDDTRSTTLECRAFDYRSSVLSMTARYRLRTSSLSRKLFRKIRFFSFLPLNFLIALFTEGLCELSRGVGSKHFFWKNSENWLAFISHKTQNTMITVKTQGTHFPTCYLSQLYKYIYACLWIAEKTVFSSNPCSISHAFFTPFYHKSSIIRVIFKFLFLKIFWIQVIVTYRKSANCNNLFLSHPDPPLFALENRVFRHSFISVLWSTSNSCPRLFKDLN